MPSPYRKACIHCVSAKRKCNLSYPRCSRCESRSLECCYTASTSTSVASATIQDADSSAAIISALDPSLCADSTAFISPERMLPGYLESESLPIQDSVDFGLDWHEMIQTTSIQDNVHPPLDCLESSYIDDDNAYNTSSTITNNNYNHGTLQERVLYAINQMKSFPYQFMHSCQTLFIHKSLYTPYMPSYLRDTLAICALYSQKTKDNEAIVGYVIRQKAKEIIGNDTTLADTAAIDQLAKLQALILLRIMQLFDGDIRLRADAEQTDLLFLGMIRQIQSRIHPLNSKESNSAITVGIDGDDKNVADSWKRWLFAESLRRTVIIGWSLAGLYSLCKNGVDSHHDEFENLTFYAQAALWEAQSGYKWSVAARNKLPLPIRFSDWDTDFQHVKPVDIEDLGMMMMVLMKGTDYCTEWVGEGLQSRFYFT